MAVENAIAVAVLVNRDLVLAPEMVRGRRRHFIVDGAPDAVAAFELESSGEWILEVLDHPEPSALVKRDGNGLAYDRLGKDQIELEVLRHLE